ncbi:DUF1289 domain-containing protein [Thalassotalea fusca]
MKNQDKAEASTTMSPCVRNCCLNEDDICLGCFRHIDEIVAWQSLTNEGKQAVLLACETRKAKCSIAKSC